MTQFAQLNLNANINKALNACGYKTPTPVQEQSIPHILAGSDVIASAQTGTGKTAAFVLPALHHLSEKPPIKGTRVLILTPTRELASQITKAAGLYGKFLRFNIVNLVGGMPYHRQIKELQRGADIIVATPGRLLDHINSGRVDLSDIDMFVLDEADRMLDMGFIEDVQTIAHFTPKSRQTLLFSATLDNHLMKEIRNLLKNPVRIDLSAEKTLPKIKQELYKVNSTQHKSRLLKHLLKDTSIYKAIIFTSTKVNADKLANQLRNEGFTAAALHGDLRQNVRNRTVDQLKHGKIQFLVATDVAARGIDIRDVTHVINYDLPRFCEDYVHRIGRTGRAGKSGIAISFVLPTDTRLLQSIERYIGQRFKLIQNVGLGEEMLMSAKAGKHEDSFAEDDRPRHDRKKFRHKEDGARSSQRRGRSEGGHFGADSDRPRHRKKPHYRNDDETSPQRHSRSDRSDAAPEGDRPRHKKPRYRNDDATPPQRRGRSDRSEFPRITEEGDRPRHDHKKPRFRSVDSSSPQRRGRSDRSEFSRSTEEGDRPRHDHKKPRFRNDDSSSPQRRGRGDRSESSRSTEEGDRPRYDHKKPGNKKFAKSDNQFGKSDNKFAKPFKKKSDKSFKKKKSFGGDRANTFKKRDRD